LNVLEFPLWVAVPVAVMIEILGFSTISTGLDFWSWNRRFSSDKNIKRAPLSFVIFAFAFYLGVVITMNVLLDVAKAFPLILSEDWAIIGVRALLTTMTIPAAMIVATRTQHHDLLDEIKRDKIDRKNKGVVVSSKTTNRTFGTGRPSKLKDPVFAYMDDIMSKEGRVVGYMELKTALKLSNNAASRLRAEWIQERNVSVSP
jgi:hypothetical protein